MTKKYRILLLDDDVEICNVISNMLEDMPDISEINACHSIQDAFLLLEKGYQNNNLFDILITDGELRPGSGAEVIIKCRQDERWSKMLILMITGYPEKYEIGYILEIGANDYLRKPFSSNLLNKKLKSLMSLEEMSKTQFSPININSLISQDSIPFDIFINQFGQTRMILNKGESLLPEYFKILKKRNLKQLLIPSDQELEYQQYLDKYIDDVLKSSNFSIEEKTSCLSEYTEIKMQPIYQSPSNANITQLKNVSESINKFIDDYQEDGLWNILQLKRDPNLYTHGLNVSSLATLLSRKIIELRKSEGDVHAVILRHFDGFFESKHDNFNLVIIAGLLHDIGRDRYGAMTLDELKKHSSIGYEKLLSIKSIHPKIPEIVLQHEEFCDGSGWPNGLTKGSISLYAQLISFSNYCEEKLTLLKWSPDQLINDLKKNYSKFNTSLIEVFGMIIRNKY